MGYYDYEDGYYRDRDYQREEPLRKDRCEKCRLSDAMDDHPKITDDVWVWCYWDGVKVRKTHTCGYFKNWTMKK